MPTLPSYGSVAPVADPSKVSSVQVSAWTHSNSEKYCWNNLEKLPDGRYALHSKVRSLNRTQPRCTHASIFDCVAVVVDIEARSCTRTRSGTFEALTVLAKASLISSHFYILLTCENVPSTSQLTAAIPALPTIWLRIKILCTPTSRSVQGLTSSHC